MSIDSVFIPCAGKGTRMGEMGKTIPKPLWPIFDITLLEFQINFFKSIGFKNFYINTHHLSDSFHSLKDKIENFSILEEPVLLGSGGSLYNLKKSFPGLERVLIANPDVFYNLSHEQWMNFLSSSQQKDRDNTLMPIFCQRSEAYNEIIKNGDDHFERVNGPNHQREYITYSGIGVIDLKSFDRVEGESSFFETVVNPKMNRTKIYMSETIEQDVNHYWDFGTLSLYIENHLKIIESSSDEAKRMFQTLSQFNSLTPKKKYKDESSSTLEVGELRIDLSSQKVELID